MGIAETLGWITSLVDMMGMRLVIVAFLIFSFAISFIMRIGDR